MRKTIAEILKELDFNINDEIEKVDAIFYSNLGGHAITLKELADKEIRNWKHRGTIISVDELRYKLNIASFGKHKTNELNNNYLLKYFEFILNMLYLTKRLLNKNLYTSAIEQDGRNKINLICENIKIISEKFGYEIEQQKDLVYLTEISPEATAVAENYEEVAQEIMEYKRFSTSNNLKRKRELLNHLSNKYEEILPNLKANFQSELYKDIGTILNNLNIRHGNPTNNFSIEELEDWYDKCYDCLLLAFMINVYLKNKTAIKNLRCVLRNKWFIILTTCLRFERMTYCLEGSCSIQLSYQGLILNFHSKANCEASQLGNFG